MQSAGISATTGRPAPTVASELASTTLPNTSSWIESCAAIATLPENLSLTLHKSLYSKGQQMVPQEIQLVLQEKFCQHGHVMAHVLAPGGICNGAMKIIVKPDVEVVIEGFVYTVEDIIYALQEIPIIFK